MRISDWSSDVCSSDLVDYQRRQETNEIFIPPGERLGSKVIEFNNVSKSFGDRLLIDNLSFIAPPGAIIGIIGPNGAGKSTLFKMITGQEKPDSRSEEHTSELQSLMRISYAVFCLKKK